MTVSALPWDVARCVGESAAGQCAIRSRCRRYAELDMATRLTLRFEPPIDGDLAKGCDLLIDMEAPDATY